MSALVPGSTEVDEAYDRGVKDGIRRALRQLREGPPSSWAMSQVREGLAQEIEEYLAWADDHSLQSGDLVDWLSVRGEWHPGLFVRYATEAGEVFIKRTDFEDGSKGFRLRAGEWRRRMGE
jgi:hypothetical protein